MKFIFGYLLVIFFIINQINYGQTDDENVTVSKEADPTTASTADKPKDDPTTSSEKPKDEQATTAKEGETTKKNDEAAAGQNTTAKPSTIFDALKNLRDTLSLLWHKFLGRPDKQANKDDKENKGSENGQKDEKGKEQGKGGEEGKGKEKEKGGSGESGSGWQPKSILLSLLLGIPKRS